MNQKTSNQLKISEVKGDIMTIASKNVVSIAKTTSILDAIKTMISNGFRRLPISDAGTKQIQGIITSKDIVDFLGGGLRYLIIKNKYNDNIFSALNSSVNEIMEENVITLHEEDSLKDALDTMIKNNIGGIPITDKDKKIKAIITEKDFVFLMSGVYTGKKVIDYMSKNIVTISYDAPIEIAAKTMIKKGFRRLPVIKDDVFMGIITASDILRYFGDGEIFNKIVTGSFKEVAQEQVKNLIKKEIVYVSDLSSDLGEIASIMLNKKVGSIPILQNRRMKGIITERDLVKAIGS